MSTLIGLEEKLTKFGLSKNETAIYLFLIKTKKSSIQDIARLNKIPRSTVYEVLKSLLNKGLVQEIVEDKKKEYKAFALSILKHNFIEEKEKLEKNIKHIDSLQEVIGNLSRSDYAKGSVGYDNFEIRKYSGKAGARQLFWNTLSAKDEVLVYSYFGRSKYVGKAFYQNFVLESKKRGIKEKVLINPSERVFNMIRKDNNTAIARTSLKDIRVIDLEKVNIQGETFIYGSTFATVYLDTDELVGFEIESKSFVETQRSIFEGNWEMGKLLRIH